MRTIRTFFLAIAVAIGLALLPSLAFAQASFTALDAGSVSRTFKSFNCSSTICSMAVPADSAGNFLGTAPGTPNASFALPVQGVTGGVAVPVSGTFWQTTQPVSGTVTANAGANLNTSLLALETGGNLATLAGGVTSSIFQDNVKQINGVVPLMGNGVTGTGSQRVTIASDNTAFSVNATLNAETTKVIGEVNQGTSPWVVSNGGTFATQSAITAASGSIASGAIASGAVSAGAFVSGSVLSGAFASGSLAAGSMVDLLTMRAAIGGTTGSPADVLVQGCQYLASPPTYTPSDSGAVQCTINGYPIVNVNNTNANITPADNLANPTTTSPVIGFNELWDSGGTQWVRAPGTAATGALTAYSSQYPKGAVPITASATGTTGATTATLAGTSGKTTYICSYSIRANATAATTVQNTITGVITGTLTHQMWVAPLASGIGVDEQIFNPCVPASGTNTGIAIVSGAPGSGGLVSSTGTGYQL